MTQHLPSSKESLARKFAIGATSDGYVNVTVFAKNGETTTKTITKDEAYELGLQILQAAR